jgi:hypothetical membrane protein
MFSVFILVILFVDLLIPFFIAIPYKTYSHTQTVMSVLGCKVSPLGRLYNVWMVVSGCSITLFGYFIFDYYRQNQYSLAITLLVSFVLYGIGDEVISGFFPVNEKKEDVTLSTKIHGIGSVVGFMAFLSAPLILGILQVKNNQVTFGICSISFFILSLIGFVFFIIGEKPKFKNTIFALTGLWQRVLCALMYTPFIIWIITRL